MKYGRGHADHKSCYAEKESWRNRGLLAALALSGLAQVAAVAFEPLRVLLGTQPLTLTQLGVCLLVVALPAAGMLTWRAAGS